MVGVARHVRSVVTQHKVSHQKKPGYEPWFEKYNKVLSEIDRLAWEAAEDERSIVTFNVTEALNKARLPSEHMERAWNYITNRLRDSGYDIKIDDDVITITWEK